MPVQSYVNELDHKWPSFQIYTATIAHIGSRKRLGYAGLTPWFSKETQLLTRTRFASSGWYAVSNSQGL